MRQFNLRSRFTGFHLKKLNPQKLGAGLDFADQGAQVMIFSLHRKIVKTGFILGVKRGREFVGKFFWHGGNDRHLTFFGQFGNCPQKQGCLAGLMKAFLGSLNQCEILLFVG